MRLDEFDRRYHRLVALLSGGGAVNEAFVAEEACTLAREGHSAAALLAANACGAGFGCERDWDQALDWLVLAAERGEPAAQAQLRFLSGRNDSAWREMAHSVDYAAWGGPRPRRLVHERPRIGIVERFTDPAMCRWAIERARPFMKRARVYSAETGGGVDHSGRSNSEATFTLLELDVPLLLLRERIARTMETTAEHLELASVFRYETGQTFAPHYDFIEPATSQLRREIDIRGQRVATFLIYLNAEFEGGETHFPSLEKRFRVPAGDGLFFYSVTEDGAPDPSTLHEGAPPTQGEKWLLSQFIRDKPQCQG